MSRKPQASVVSPLPLDKHPARIRSMFDAIAGQYDLLNHLLSAGLDRRWRRHAITSLGLSWEDTLLDVCTGTGDVVLAALGSGASPRRAVGVDFAGAMLGVAQSKLRLPAGAPSGWFVRGDALRLPIRSASVSAATVAFGMRNVEDLPSALGELRRVLRPGGRLAVLEFGLPTAPGVRGIYTAYFRYVVPRIGRVISGHHQAYSYLNASVEDFPSGRAFLAALETAGFSQTKAVRLTLGIVYLYTARRS